MVWSANSLIAEKPIRLVGLTVSSFADVTGGAASAAVDAIHAAGLAPSEREPERPIYLEWGEPRTLSSVPGSSRDWTWTIRTSLLIISLRLESEMEGWPDDARYVNLSK